jgi:hypothetical protein
VLQVVAVAASGGSGRQLQVLVVAIVGRTWLGASLEGDRESTKGIARVRVNGASCIDSHGGGGIVGEYIMSGAHGTGSWCIIITRRVLARRQASYCVAGQVDDMSSNPVSLTYLAGLSHLGSPLPFPPNSRTPSQNASMLSYIPHWRVYLLTRRMCVECRGSVRWKARSTVLISIKTPTEPAIELGVVSTQPLWYVWTDIRRQ